MRLLLFSIGSIIILLACKNSISKEQKMAQESNPQVDSILTYPVYPFKDSFIDLETLKASKFITSRNYNFKQGSKFKYRFYESDWFQLPKDTILHDKYCSYEFVNPSVIKIVNPDYEESYVDLPHEIFENKIEQQPFTLEHKDGIVLIYKIPDSLCYYIYKMNWTGKIIQQTKVQHTEVTHPQKNENYYDFYLHPIAYNQNQLVFSNNWHNYQIANAKTIIVDLEFLTTTEIKHNSKGLVWDENEEFVEGIVISKIDEKSKTLEHNYFYFDIKNKSETKLELSNFMSSVNTLRYKNLLIIANYHPIATGSSLCAYDLTTQKKIWEADVKQLNVGHSKYHNKVTLSLYTNKIIMEGNEAYGNYVQIFNVEDGKRIKTFGKFNEN